MAIAMTTPLDRGLNVAILQIASRLFPCGFDVAADAPDTFDRLKDHVAATGRMCVYSGGSDGTIYACPEVNYAFRAWHDWCHLKGNFAFTPEGEAGALAMQVEHLRTLYGNGPTVDHWAEVLDAEINGQLAYQARNGCFPADQMAFVKLYMLRPMQAMVPPRVAA